MATKFGVKVTPCRTNALGIHGRRAALKGLTRAQRRMPILGLPILTSVQAHAISVAAAKARAEASLKALQAMKAAEVAA